MSSFTSTVATNWADAVRHKKEAARVKIEFFIGLFLDTFPIDVEV
jgi:hypothetical protein